MLYCVAENRQDCEIGLRYLLITFRRFCPEGRIAVFYPEPCDTFKNWLTKIPQAEHISDFPDVPKNAGWNCKPYALLSLLERGEEEVIWLDSDIMLTRDPSPLFTDLSLETLVAAQEPLSQPYQGTEIRTNGWNLPVGRSLPWTLNSCVVRVTSYHIPLLKKWIELLNHPEYITSASLPIAQRPIHLLGDQDVLGALVGATEFADFPVYYLRSGINVIHCGGALGYSLRERFIGLFKSIPTFIHGIGCKPWIMFHENHTPRFCWYPGLRRLLVETSPYMALCRSYESEVEFHTLPAWLGNGSWLHRHSCVGLFFRVIGLGHHALRGLPLTAIATVVDPLKKWLNVKLTLINKKQTMIQD
ncbi:hypothetical protein [Chroococcus sp. FPU101]|uniref:hypothetical protein n=1 Tax=Chroococcus sp. FPU101 TaxID=1974212 RepID=UPI001A8FC6C2|nr:hypothetical protein [Chroococcus sp. FPU101]GFE68196.1 hypothetical protein CFPU101_08060 [Chroococcus sp. FPU101]